MLRYRYIFEKELKTSLEIESKISNLEWLNEVSLTNLYYLLEKKLNVFLAYCNSETEKIYVIKAYTMIIATAIAKNYKSIEEYESSSSITRNINQVVKTYSFNNPDKMLEVAYFLADESIKNLELIYNAILVMAVKKYYQVFEFEKFELIELFERLELTLDRIPERMRKYTRGLESSSRLNMIYLMSEDSGLNICSPQLINFITSTHEKVQ